MTAADWIANARSLTQSSSIPLGVPVNTHMDMLLRDTRRDLRTAADALEKALELADRWASRGEHLMAYSKTVPEEVGTSLLEAGADFVEKARVLRTAITEALGVES